MGNSDDLYDQILTTHGAFPQTLFLVLSRLKQEGQLQRVIQASLNALDTYPNDIYIRRLLAETYFETGLISEAEAELEKVIELIGSLTDVYKLQAEIYKRQERKKEAAEALNVYLAHQPDDEEAHRLLNDLRPAEEMPVSEPQPTAEEIPAPSEEDITEEPYAPEEAEAPDIATPTLAELYFDQGQMQEAINTYKTLVEEDPEDGRSRDRLRELEAMAVEKAQIGAEGFDPLRKKKEKTIAILESWRANIRAQLNPA